MTRSRRPNTCALLVVPLALLAAACGGDEEPAPADTVAEVTPTTTVAPATDAPTTTVAPTTDAPTTDAPTTDVPTTDAPTTDVPTTDVPTTDVPTTDVPTTDVPTTDVPTTEAAAGADLPAYQTLTITDVDGATFTLHDLAGKPVFVEAFATWCPNCRKQLGLTNAAAATLGDTAVVLALSVETDLSSDEVAAYADDNGFDNIRFAVVSPEMLAALVDAFGNTIANPPSTPKFVLDAAGGASELATGPESADAIVAAVQAASA